MPVVRIDEDVYREIIKIAKKKDRSISKQTNRLLRGLISKPKGIDKMPRGKI